MDLSFATDSNRFSTVVEQLRKEGSAITEETIKARYEALGKVDAPKVEEVVEKTEEEPKKKAKKSK
jgi:hypothetical protein